jgi:hypothetical protein
MRIELVDGDTRTDITEGVKVLYDNVVGSMDWGSGFLGYDEELAILKLAAACGFIHNEEVLEKLLVNAELDLPPTVDLEDAPADGPWGDEFIREGELLRWYVEAEKHTYDGTRLYLKYRLCRSGEPDGFTFRHIINGLTPRAERLESERLRALKPTQEEIRQANMVASAAVAAEWAAGDPGRRAFEAEQTRLFAEQHAAQVLAAESHVPEGVNCADCGTHWPCGPYMVGAKAKAYADPNVPLAEDPKWAELRA